MVNPSVLHLTPLLCIILQVSVGNAYNILAFDLFPSRSHTILMQTILEELATRGHNITCISQNANQSVNPQVTWIQNAFYSVPTDFKYFERGHIKAISNVYDYYNYAYPYQEHILKVLFTMEYLKPEYVGKFDLMIFGNFVTECLFGVAYHLQVPVIVVGPSGQSSYVNDLVGNPTPFSYVPHIYTSFTDRMTIWQRMENTITHIFDHAYRHWVYLPTIQSSIQEYVPNFPPLGEVITNTSVVLVNSHFTTRSPQAFLPNMIEIGGAHIKSKITKSQIPDDLKQHLDNSEDGFIYMSFGTVVCDNQIPVNIEKIIYNVLKNLTQKIVWKRNRIFDDGNPNILLYKWLPQEAMLAHPKIRLFITHGGLLSMTEAVYYGVPLLGIPLFADQKMNIQFNVQKGAGLYMDIQTITEESLRWAINESIYNPSYLENAKKLSVLIRDQPEPPLDRAMYWCEYVARHKGALHLRNAAIDMPLHVFLLLDILIIVVLVVMIGFVCIVFGFQQIVKYSLFAMLLIVEKIGLKTNIDRKKNK